MERNWPALAKAVTDARNQLHLTQAQLAEVSGVSRATIQKLERGEPVRAVTLAKIEPVLRWATGSAEDILSGSGGPIEIELNDASTGAWSYRISSEDLQNAVTAAVIAASSNVTTTEIREINRRVLEDLRERGLLPAE